MKGSIRKCKNDNCNKVVVDKRASFCSRSCSAITNNKGVRRHGKAPANCPGCSRKLAHSRKIYCTRKCEVKHKRNNYIQRWKAGKETGMVGKNYALSKIVKRYLRDLFGDKCQQCGWNKVNEYTGIIPLQANHIDGNFMNTIESNLELLCPNCHSLTSTFGSSNKKGNGRRIKGCM